MPRRRPIPPRRPSQRRPRYDDHFDRRDRRPMYHDDEFYSPLRQRDRFSFAQMTSNEDGKTSGSGTMGVVVTIIGCIAFLAGIVDKIFFTGTVDIMVQTIVFTGIGAGLLGVRKWRAANAQTEIEMGRGGSYRVEYSRERSRGRDRYDYDDYDRRSIEDEGDDEYRLFEEGIDPEDYEGRYSDD